ncbi:MAG TPA: ABC transporter permease, partial [Acidimicrobiia bacterium]
TATPRWLWIGSHLAFGVLGPGLLLLVAGLTMGLSYGAVSGDTTGQAFRVLGVALAQLPAVWVLTGVAVALFGLAPRLTGLSWGVLVTCLLLGQLGQILQFPQWALNLSPFTHVSRIPAQSLDMLPLGVLAALASLLTLAGLIGFRSRDLEPD